MPQKIKQLCLNLLVLFLALCVTIALAEVLVRAFSHETDNAKWVGPTKLFYEHDSLLGWRMIPNIEKNRIGEGGKTSVFYQVNSKGIRGPEYPYEKPDDEYRILLLGDSFAEGYLVEFEDLFSEVMRHELESMNPRRRFLAINSGTAAWSTDQELLFFQSEGKKYKPDLTVLMFYQNDLTYNNRSKNWSMYHKPMFKYKDEELVLTNVPVPEPDNIEYYAHITQKEESAFKRIRRWLYKNLYLYNLVKKRIKNSFYLNKLATDLHLIEKPEQENNLLQATIYKFWEKAHDESVDEAWQITEALLVKLKEETDSIGSRLLVFFIPHEATINKEMWIKIKNEYGLSDENQNIDQVGIKLGNICEKNNIDFLNPTELFRAKSLELKTENKSLYSPLDRHWGVEGHKFTGELLADYVASNNLAEKDSK